MRTLALCCILLFVAGCDTLGGRTVVLKLGHVSQPHSSIRVQEALLYVDEVVARDGIKRVAAPPGDSPVIADYVGGHFICRAAFYDNKLAVDFRNPHFGGGPPDADVVKVSDEVAAILRREYGAKQVKIKN